MLGLEEQRSDFPWRFFQVYSTIARLSYVQNEPASIQFKYTKNITPKADVLEVK